MSNQFSSVEIQDMVMGDFDFEKWVAEDAPFERTRAERWTALSIEEQDAVIEASEEEAGLRYDARGNQW